MSTLQLSAIYNLSQSTFKDLSINTKKQLYSDLQVDSHVVSIMYTKQTVVTQSDEILQQAEQLPVVVFLSAK